MKPSSLLPISILCAGLALSFAPARADDPSSPPVPPATPAAPETSPADGGQQVPGGHHRHMRAFVLADLTKKLDLSADQQKAVGAIIASADGQLRGLRGDDSLSMEDKRAKMREIVGSERAQIRAALTPDQQKTFDALPVNGGRRPQGEPNPAPAN